MNEAIAFTEDYYLRGEQSGLSNYTNYRWLPSLTRPLARRIADQIGLTTEQTVLDFGCARGYLVRALRELGFNAYGCDISAWAIDNCDPNVVRYLKCQSLPDRSFHWIIAKDVLEHVPKDKLEQTLQALMDEAILGLFFVVPLARENGAEYVAPPDNQDTTHVTRWTLETWIKYLGSIDKAFTVTGSYHYPGIKPASSKWDWSCGFLTCKRI